MKKLLSAFLFCFLITACEKETNDPVKPEQPPVIGPVSVLNDNSGFDTVMNVVRVLSSATVAPPGIYVADFSLEANNNFNIVYYTEFPSQQSVIASYSRFTKNLATQAIVPLPPYADNLSTFSPAQIQNSGYNLTLQQFRPYSNYFTYAQQRPGSFSINNSIEFKGDYSALIKTANPVGVADLGFYYPVANIEGASARNNAFGYFTLGTPSPSYLTKVCNPLSLTYLNKSNASVVCSLLEARYSFQGASMEFAIRSDSLIASEVNINDLTKIKVAAIATSQITGNAVYKTMRHYTPDGNILAILLHNEIASTFWTFTYNFATRTLTKGLENAHLDYGDTGSDYDLDEAGNIYYSGYAANGANKTSVTIYKKDITGMNTRIGADAFLKNGRIIKLKYLSGKVFVAVNGKQTGTSTYQLTILKQL